jgi:hypothetical protein
LSRQLVVATTTKPNLFHLATSEAGARWPRFGFVVVATTSRRDDKVQGPNHLDLVAAIASCGKYRT